jgi:hypothetical protein
VARLTTSGGELRDHLTVSIGNPDGYSGGAAVTATETTVIRSGSASIKCAGTSANSSYRIFPFTAQAAGTSLYARVYVRLSALPNATKTIVRFSAGATNIVGARLTSAGKLQLFNAVAGTQIGSDSAETLAVDRWYRVELKVTIGAGSTDAAELRLATDEAPGPDYASVQVAATSGASITDTQPTELRAGWVDAPGVTADMFLDDVGINSSAGTAENSWPVHANVVLLLPRSHSGANWRNCAGDATPIAEYINNTPPKGVATHETAGHTTPSNDHQALTTATSSGTLQVRTQSYAGAAVAGDAFSHYTTSTASQFIGATSGEARAAQSFFLKGTLAFVEVNVQRSGSPTDDLVLEIQTDSGSNTPSGTVLLSGQVVGSSLPSGSFAWTRFAFDPTPLTPGTKYWLVLSRSGSIDASNFYAWEYSGFIAGDAEALEYNGTNWVAGTSATASLTYRVFSSDGQAQVRLVQPVVCHGEGVGTGTKSGGTQLQTNPTAGALSSWSYGDDVGAAGTYPTNWRWDRGVVTYAPTIARGGGARFDIFKTDGTNRAALVSFAGVYVEYAPPESPGWQEYIKTSDSSHWWAKFVSTNTVFQYGTMGENEVEVQAGDYALHADPLPAAEADMTTVTSVTKDTLEADYTKV